MNNTLILFDVPEHLQQFLSPYFDSKDTLQILSFGKKLMFNCAFMLINHVMFASK